jgi:glycosyltransferase involved in cell wall biosynthesis
LGAYDPGYPRNRILREGLRLAGVEIIEARVRDRRVLFRYPALALQYARRAARAGTVIVPEFRHKDMPLARLLAGRRRLVFDPLVSRHDTLVGDWGLHGRDSFQARWNLAIDRAALCRADLVLCDTWAHGALFETLGVPRARLERVLVGAEAMFFAVPPVPPAPPVRIAYVGGFLPLHGTLTIVEALARLEREPGLPEFQCELAGKGIEFDAARDRARAADLERTEFTGPVAYAASPGVLARAHIVLGAFGRGEKAGRVIPHKVYQGLAAGRAVLTGDGDGLREVFEPERHLCAVPRGDAEALAAALSRLIRDAALRDRLGACGKARACEVATPERIGAGLRAALEGSEVAQ